MIIRVLFLIVFMTLRHWKVWGKPVRGRPLYESKNIHRNVLGFLIALSLEFSRVSIRSSLSLLGFISLLIDFVSLQVYIYSMMFWPWLVLTSVVSRLFIERQAITKTRAEERFRFHVYNYLVCHFLVTFLTFCIFLWLWRLWLLWLWKILLEVSRLVATPSLLWKIFPSWAFLEHFPVWLRHEWTGHRRFWFQQLQRVDRFHAPAFVTDCFCFDRGIFEVLAFIALKQLTICDCLVLTVSWYLLVTLVEIKKEHINRSNHTKWYIQYHIVSWVSYCVTVDTVSLCWRWMNSQLPLRFLTMFWLRLWRHCWWVSSDGKDTSER